MAISHFSNTIQTLSQILLPFEIDLMKIFAEIKNSENCGIVETFVSLTAYQIAIIDLLNFIGLKHHGLIGLSSGEISCAYSDGVIDAQQAIMIAYWSGKYKESELKRLDCSSTSNSKENEKRCINFMNIL
jgi:hypothetical protein